MPVDTEICYILFGVAKIGIKHLHPKTESMKHQHLWEKLYLISEQCPEVGTVYSRARPGDHHHRVGAEEECEQWPSDGPDVCGVVQRCGGEDGRHNCIDD